MLPTEPHNLVDTVQMEEEMSIRPREYARNTSIFSSSENSGWTAVQAVVADEDDSSEEEEDE
jgi:hypothetical protein